MLLFYKIVTALYFLSNVIGVCYAVVESQHYKILRGKPFNQRWFKSVSLWLFFLFFFTPVASVSATLEDIQRRRKAAKHKNP